MATALIDSVLHWRRKLEKDPDDDYILNVIRKLSKVPITLEILEATHIGKTIRKLSKRDDIVGEKAKTVLSKWREVFIHQGSDKNQKLPNDSKKENVNKESKSSSKHSSYEKIVHSEKQSSHYHERKQKSDSLSPSLSEQSSRKYVNGSYKANNSTESSHSLYKYDVKERNSNYLDYDPHTESSEGYNPECPELFPTDKPVKTKKPVLVETYEPSSVKRKLTDEKEQNEEKSRHKKHKSGSHSSSDNDTDSKKSSEKKDKHNLHKEKTKYNSHSSTLKKELDEVASHKAKKHESETHAKKTKCKESSETDRTKHKKPKVKILSTEEFTSSEVSFEDCLGFNDIVSLKKSSKSHASTKKQPSSSNPSKEKPTEKSKKDAPKTVSTDLRVKVSKDSSSHANKEKVSKDSAINKTKVSKDSSHFNKNIPFVVPKPSSKIDMSDMITSSLPDIQPNYRPLPRSPDFYSPKKKALSNEDAIRFMSSRKEKTAVYSGRKCSTFYTEVPSLFDICIRVLSENIDAIECCGDASYDMMKPILEKCTPIQLYTIENFNPHYIEDTNDLWEAHCKRDYKLLQPMEHETWRELYWRAHDEREKKLKSVTANITKSIAKSTPVRQVKLAYVDLHGYVKPPRDVARKQAKHGTAALVNHAPVKQSSPSKPSPRPSVPAAASSAASSSSSSSSAFKKPKVAPLMAKTLKSLKAFRRK